MKNALVALLALSAVEGLAITAAAAPHGIMRPVGVFGPTSGGNLQYYGGPVISNAKIYAVYWTGGVPAEYQKKLPAFYSNMLDSTYMDWLSEYDTNLRAVDGRAGTNQHIGRGTFEGSVTIVPTTQAKSLTDEMVQKELESQIAAGKLKTPDDNTLYMIYFPTGYSISIEGQRSCSAFCAYHEGFKSGTFGNVFYGIMPACAANCAFGGTPFDSLTAVSSHEAIEAITDPFPTPGSNPAYPQAWNDAQGEEISDKCSEGAAPITGHGTVSKATWNWQNSISGCNRGPWKQSAGFVRFFSDGPVLQRLKRNPNAVFGGL